MKREKRCHNEQDFIELYCANKAEPSEIVDLPEKAINQSYHNIQEFIHKRDGSEAWRNLIKEENEFYGKYGYIDVIYHTKSDTYHRKKVRGRPKTSNPKSNRITIRISDEELKIIDNYCSINKIKDRSEALREAIRSLGID